MLKELIKLSNKFEILSIEENARSVNKEGDFVWEYILTLKK